MSPRPLRRLTLVGSVLVLAFCVTPSRAQEKRKDPGEVTKAMEKLLRDFQDENTQLRNRVSDLEAEVARLKQSRIITTVPQATAPSQLPPGWKAVPFNGGMYYLVPLGSGQPQLQTNVRTPAGAGTEVKVGDRDGIVTYPARTQPNPK